MAVCLSGIQTGPKTLARVTKDLECKQKPRCQVEYQEKEIARILKLLHSSSQKFKHHNTTQVGPREDYGARLAAD